MRRDIILFSIIAILSSTLSYGQGMYGSVRGLAATIRSFEYQNDSVYVNLDFSINGLNISTNESVVYMPKIFKGDNSIELPTIVVRGRASAKAYNRAHDLNAKLRIAEYKELYGMTYYVSDFYGKKAALQRSKGAISYKCVLPYETWMVDSEMEITCTSLSCCNVVENGKLFPKKNTLTIDMLSVDEYDVSPLLSDIVPERVAVKNRDIQYSSALVFKVGSAVIDPSVSRNEQELASIREMMQSVISDKDYTITSVNIVGYASPEGSLLSNQKLSQKRAHALESIMKRDYLISHDLYHVEFGGENWEDLVPMVEASDLANKSQVLNLIKNVSINDGRERQLMDLGGGVSYKYMLKNFFPLVRKVIVDVAFTVKAYNLERIKELIYEKPENLSLLEMYQYAETYDQDERDYLKAMMVAVNHFPQDEVAVSNAMQANIIAGDMDMASTFVSRMDENSSRAEVVNTLGVYYMLEGRYNRAKTLLERARELGSEDAQHNLDQLAAKVQNIEDLEASKLLREKIYGK